LRVALVVAIATGWMLLAGVQDTLAISLSGDPFLEQAGPLTSPEITEFAEQGASVAVSANGDTALVGAPFFTLVKGGGGAAFVYVRSGASWSLQQKIVPAGLEKDAQFGSAVALSADGNTALIGAQDNRGGVGEPFFGASWVYTRTATSWSEQQKLVGEGEHSTEKARQGSGVALSADGKTALIGAEDNETGIGGAFVFALGSKWEQQGKILIGKHGTEIPLEGHSVALSAEGSTALIGGPKDEGTAKHKGEGAVWAFVYSGGTWKEQAELPAGNGVGEEVAQGSGVALSGDGNTAIVGGPGYSKLNGAAWVYTRSGTTWTEQAGPLLGEDPSTEPEQGMSVALSESGNTALVGGSANDVSLGATWAFTRSGSTWSEQRKLVGLHATVPTEQGWAVALSADGGTALVGAPGNDGTEGAFWVFARAPETEKEKETEKPPEKTTTGGGGGSMTTTTTATTASTTSTTAGIASTPAAIEALRLGCSRAPLVLNDAYIHGARVALAGSAASSLIGKKLKILFGTGRKLVATAVVQHDGEFTATAPLPPASIREALSTRYEATYGNERSLHLKLTRRLLLEPPRFASGKVTLTGREFPPLTEPLSSIVVEQQLECGHTTIVKTVTPPKNGVFHITVTVPARARAAIFTLKSKVAANARARRHGFTTYSLPLPVVLG
jgi:hypothetical protein